MNHRRADVRAAVFARQRSQGHLRAVTATVGVAGVVTAGVVAAFLPGSTHASASSRTTSGTAPSAPLRQQQPRRQRGHQRCIRDSGRQASSAPPPHHRQASAPAAATTAPAAPVPTPAATTAPPQGVSGGS